MRGVFLGGTSVGRKELAAVGRARTETVPTFRSERDSPPRANTPKIPESNQHARSEFGGFPNDYLLALGFHAPEERMNA
jgi:hypothetical protein